MSTKRNTPATIDGGIAFAAATNAALWLLLLWLVRAGGRAVRRVFAAGVREQ